MGDEVGERRDITASAESVVMNVEILARDSLYLLSLMGCGSDRLRPAMISLALSSMESIACHDSRAFPPVKKSKIAFTTNGHRDIPDFVPLELFEGISTMDQVRLVRRSDGEALGRRRRLFEKSGEFPDFAKISRSSGKTSKIECGRSLD